MENYQQCLSFPFSFSLLLNVFHAMYLHNKKYLRGFCFCFFSKLGTVEKAPHCVLPV